MGKCFGQVHAQLPAGIIGSVFIDLGFIFIHIFAEIAADFFFAAGVLQDCINGACEVAGFMIFYIFLRWIESMFFDMGQFFFVFLYPFLVQFLVDGADSFGRNQLDRKSVV